MTQLKQYQRDSVATVGGWLAANLGTGKADRFGLLQAPTGSGKTIMLAKILEERCQGVVVLWLSPGKGDLEEQSFRSLNRSLSGTTIDPVRLTSVYLASHPRSDPGTVLVANWEEINTDDKVLVRGSERVKEGLYGHLAATSEAGTEVIIVIDESHFGAADVKKAQSAIKTFLANVETALGYPFLRLEATATPVVTPSAALCTQGIQVYAEVSLDDVIGEGMLVKEIRFNSGLRDRLAALPDEDAAAVTGEQLVLDAAWTKTLDLRREYVEIGSPVRPLLLVQLPNNTATDDRAAQKRKTVEAFFAQHGITIDNGKMLAWFSGEERDEQAAATIANFDSSVEVLLFKQGISLGWDCPRAQVLVAFRDMASDIFKIQTIGRVMRMPERKHYDDPARDGLDCAFVYSNLKITTHVTRDPGAPPTMVDLMRRHPALSLPGAYMVTTGGGVDLTAQALLDALSKDPKASEVYDALSADDIAALRVTDQVADSQVVTMEEVHAGKVEDNETTRVEAFLSDGDREAQFTDTLLALVGGFANRARATTALRSGLYRWLRPLWGGTDDVDAWTVGIQRLLLHPAHKDAIIAVLDRALDKCREGLTATTRERRTYLFTTLETLAWDAAKISPVEDAAKTYLYADGNSKARYTTAALSKPEEAFVAQISDWRDQGLITWWWKNGEARDAEGPRRFFSITYRTADGSQATTYPDFIVLFADGRVGVFEVKEPAMEAGIDKDARRKAAALAAWQPENVIAGVAYEKVTGRLWNLATSLDANDDQPINDAL